jgi:hypothetical protein
MASLRQLRKAATGKFRCRFFIRRCPYSLSCRSDRYTTAVTWSKSQVRAVASSSLLSNATKPLHAPALPVAWPLTFPIARNQPNNMLLQMIGFATDRERWPAVETAPI